MTERPSTVRSIALPASVVLVVWAIAGAIRIVHPSAGRIDRGWDAFADARNMPVLHAVAEAFAVVGGGWPAVVLALAVAALLGLVRGWGWAVFTLLASIVSELDVLGLKALAMRARPDSAFGVGTSFPSGHTANAALLATVVVLLIRRPAVRVPVVLLVVVMAWSRTAIHAHWLSDVVVGALVGAATAVLLHGLWSLLLARSGERRRRARPRPARDLSAPGRIQVGSPAAHRPVAARTRREQTVLDGSRALHEEGPCVSERPARSSASRL